MNFRFLTGIAKRKQREQATAETELAARQKQYSGLLIRAVRKDDLADDEAILLDTLHREFGQGDLACVAVEIAERDTIAASPKVSPAEKSLTESRNLLAAHDAAIAEARSKFAATLEKMNQQRMALVQKTGDAENELEAARARDARRLELEARHWSILGLPDPAIAAGHIAAQQAEKNAIESRRLSVLHFIELDSRQRNGQGIEFLMREPERATAILADFDLVQSDSQTAEDFENIKDAIRDLAASGKPGRYLAMRGDFAVIDPGMRDLLLWFDDEMVQTPCFENSPSQFNFVCAPRQTKKELGKMVAKLFDKHRADQPVTSFTTSKTFADNKNSM